MSRGVPVGELPLRDAILALLPRAPKKHLASTDLIEALRHRGHDVTTRAVQGQLRQLEASELIELVTSSKPYRARLAPDAPSVRVDPYVGLALLVARGSFEHLLPPAAATVLSNALTSARRVVAERAESRWLDKVRLWPTGFQLGPALIEDRVLRAVVDALERDRQLEVHYTKRAASNEELAVLNPLALVQRTGLLTLVCTRAGSSETRQFHLHRMRTARVLDGATQRPTGFDIDAHVGRGEIGMKLADPQRVVLTIDASIVPVFREHAFGANSEGPTAMDDGRFRVAGTVPLTLELKRFIVGYAQLVEVLEPRDLRDDVHATLAKAAAQYAP